MKLPITLEGKRAVIVTMHGKERAIQPVLGELGLRFLEPPPIDTDRFGTFTRDIARSGTQQQALLAKARAGLDLVAEADFAIASEGAFGPHPTVPFVPAGFELVVLLDRPSGKSVTGRDLTLKTNYRQAEARNLDDVDCFARECGFPEHGIVLMETRDGPHPGEGYCR